MRKHAREVAFCKLYEYLLSGSEEGFSLDIFQTDEGEPRFSLSSDDLEFCRVIFDSAMLGAEKYRAQIGELAKGFATSRVYKTDLAALMLAMGEIENTDTPPAVCVNEVVELVKRYSTAKSATFVNGVLAEFLRNLGNTKTGAGEEHDGN